MIARPMPIVVAASFGVLRKLAWLLERGVVRRWLRMELGGEMARPIPIRWEGNTLGG